MYQYWGLEISLHACEIRFRRDCYEENTRSTAALSAGDDI